MIHFGIIGAGNIARKFRDAVRLSGEGDVIAVAGKDAARVRQWAEQEQVADWYGSYDELLRNDQIQAVYIATTHNYHKENILACLNAGKHVICEKPLVLHREDAEEVFALARRKQLFIMEGMWTRFLPKSQTVCQWVNDGRIGKVKLMTANIGWVANPKDSYRIFAPELAGGSLYDLGVYPLSMLPYYAGEKIVKIQPMIQYHETGVDDIINMNIQLEHSFANIQCSFTTKMTEDAYLYGDKGYIRIPKFHYGTDAFLYDCEGVLKETFKGPDENGFVYEVREVVRCIEAGLLESSVCPHSMTLETAAIYDACLGIGNGGEK